MVSNFVLLNFCISFTASSYPVWGYVFSINLARTTSPKAPKIKALGLVRIILVTLINNLT